ncbi:MAG: hypothetical protein ACFFC3_03925 [Candidatus Odinarchaeota archaeon]
MNSLIDNTYFFTYRAEDREFGTDPAMLYLTGSLSVKFLNPTPLN